MKPIFLALYVRVIVGTGYGYAMSANGIYVNSPVYWLGFALLLGFWVARCVEGKSA